MDSDSLNQLPTPKEQTYFKLHKPKLALVVDNTKQKKSKVISYENYMKQKLGGFFEFLFDAFWTICVDFVRQAFRLCLHFNLILRLLVNLLRFWNDFLICYF